MAASRTPPPPIGGFFEAAPADGRRTGQSVLAAWTEGRPYAAFVNARSAFAALVQAFPQANIWLPAFLCADLLQPVYAQRARFYAVEDGFKPDLTAVEADVKAGDLVLLAALFGVAVGDRARDLVRRRQDLRFVEDRAQALDVGPALPGAWTLYSPRKLLGVADGGLLVAPEGAGPPPAPREPCAADSLWAAPRMRAQDPAGLANAAWHAANQAKEAAMAATWQAMSRESLQILDAAPLRELADRRLANWRTLHRTLAPWSALPDAPASPLGYVLRLPGDRRDQVRGGLHAERIFAAVHWPRIAAPAADFPREAAWTRELLTLPCDHRYGDAEMARVAACAAELLR